MNLQPLKQIRKYCVECSGDSIYEIINCPATNCDLYLLRFGKGIKGIKNLKAIRNRCIDYCGYDDWQKRTKECEFNGKDEKLCPLHMFRMGKNPQLKRKGNSNIGKIGNNLRKGSVTSDKKTESDIKEVL